MDNREIIFNLLSNEHYDDALKFLNDNLDSNTEEYQILLEIINDLTPLENDIIIVSLLSAHLWEDLIFFMDEKFQNDSEYYNVITAIAKYYLGKKLESLNMLNIFISSHNKPESLHYVRELLTEYYPIEKNLQMVIERLADAIMVNSIQSIERRHLK